MRLRGGRHARAAIARIAAQLLMQDDSLGFLAARTKATERYGCVTRRDLPELSEIESALIEQQQIFGGDAHRKRVHYLREQAIHAMEFLSAFEPRLVGPVLSGTAGPNAGITLHVVADTAEEVIAFLSERDVPTNLYDRRYRDSEPCPRITFIAGAVPVSLVVFPFSQRHHPPKSDLTGRPMLRADINNVRELLRKSTEPVASLDDSPNTTL